MVDELLRKMRDGVSASVLAEEFADALNKAEKEYNDIQKEEEAKKAALVHKREGMKEVLSSIYNYLDNFYGDNDEVAALLASWRYEADDEVDNFINIIDKDIKLLTSFKSNLFSPFTEFFSLGI